MTHDQLKNLNDHAAAIAVWKRVLKNIEEAQEPNFAPRTFEGLYAPHVELMAVPSWPWQGYKAAMSAWAIEQLKNAQEAFEAL